MTCLSPITLEDMHPSPPTHLFPLQPPFLKNCELKDCLVAETDDTGGSTAFTGACVMFDNLCFTIPNPIAVLLQATLTCVERPRPTPSHTGTKVIATIGPSCQDPEVLGAMLNAGMVRRERCHRVPYGGRQRVGRREQGMYVDMTVVIC